MSKRTIAQALKSFIPNWLAERPSLKVGYNILFAIATVLDTLEEQLFEGTLAPFPGLGDPSALPLTGRGRGLVQGLTETDDAYAIRLRDWIDAWAGAGSEESLLTQLQGFLGGNLVIRHIMRTGNFVTINADGTFSYDSDPTWDWDSELLTLNPEDRPTDVWLVIYITDSRWPIYSGDLTSVDWIAAWGAQVLGAGHKVPPNAIDGVNSIIASWKAAHVYLRAIIWTNDTSLFVPGALGGVPDGTFGNWSRVDGSNNQVPARLTDNGGGKYVRYWTPEFGG